MFVLKRVDKLRKLSVLSSTQVFSVPLKQLVSSLLCKTTTLAILIFFTANVDYDQESQEIIFNPGDVIRCVEIDTLPDTVLENTERFIAQLILPADTVDLGVTPGDRTETTISIIDNDGKVTSQLTHFVNITLLYCSIYRSACLSEK